jgi:non-heme chloroperoxidase
VLMVGGRESQLWLCEHATVTAADNQFGRAVVIEDCGHIVTIDQLGRFNEVLLDFLRTTPVAG